MDAGMIDQETLLMLLAVSFLGGFVCGTALMSLWFSYMMAKIRRANNPFKDARNRLDSLLGGFSNGD